MAALDELTDDELRERLDQAGGQRALARELNMSQSTLHAVLERRKIVEISMQRSVRPRQRSINKRLPSISLDDIHEGMVPPNNCKVAAFLELLDEGSREAVKQALKYEREELPAPTLRKILVDQGFDADLVPGVDAINHHRNGSGSCRCKG